jgi:hypothetical protein
MDSNISDTFQSMALNISVDTKTIPFLDSGSPFELVPESF